MGLPESLAGLAGFIIFVVFIVAITVPDFGGADAQNIKNAQQRYSDNYNNTVNSTSTQQPTGIWGFIGQVTGLNGVYDFIIGFFTNLLNFAQLTLSYGTAFNNISAELPTEFYVMFAIVGSAIIIGIIKLVFLNGD